MKRFATISILLSLTIFAGCTAGNRVAIEARVVTPSPPQAALVPCPSPYPRARLKRTRDVFDRGDHNEKALAICAAQVDTIREWAEAIDEVPK